MSRHSILCANEKNELLLIFVEYPMAKPMLETQLSHISATTYIQEVIQRCRSGSWTRP